MRENNPPPTPRVQQMLCAMNTSVRTVFFGTYLIRYCINGVPNFAP